MSTRSKLDELRVKTEEIELGGGLKAIQKQHDKGKYTARERLTMLLMKALLPSWINLLAIVVSILVWKNQDSRRRCGYRLWYHRWKIGLCLCSGFYSSWWKPR